MMQSGATSHAALLAYTIGVPVVGGVPQLAGQVHDGDMVIVDGNQAHILVNPSELAVREYSIRREIFHRFRGELAGLREAPAETLDGRRVRLSVNIGLAEEVPHALTQGAEGIGLLRTEYFFLSRSQPPTEEDQYRFYAGIVDAVAPHRVTFRTFDLGADKMAGVPAPPEANPMLGCRGIRVLLEHRDQFVEQMRALLRASAHGPIRVMFPLVTSLTEFQDTMRVVNQLKQDLRAEGVAFDDGVPFGCMMETPAAATIPDILATEVEFFSIGSNDLIQYTLAADRTNPRVSYVYEPLHLAVLRMMRTIIRAGHRHNRSVSLCGEMASDPIYTIILLGLGVDELSVNPAMVPAIKQIIRGVTSGEAREVARGVLRERRAKDVQSYLEKMMASRFPQVMSVYGRSE
jgi:phosphotransferase system enzyme I (PtsI)